MGREIATTGLINVAFNYSINVTLALVSSFKGEGKKNKSSFPTVTEFCFPFLGWKWQGGEEPKNN